jgi:hypothetical protein
MAQLDLEIRTSITHTLIEIMPYDNITDSEFNGTSPFRNKCGDLLAEPSRRPKSNTWVARYD